MTKNLIIMDIDFTLHDYYLAAKSVVKELHGIELTRTVGPDWESFMTPIDGNHVFTEDELQVLFDRSQDRDMIFASNPYPGAVEALHVLTELGYEIKYFTDRKLHSAKDTEDWLTHHNFPDPSNLVVSRDKRQKIVDLKDQILTIVDDRVRTMIWARYELGLDKVFSLRHPFNCNMIDVDNVFLEDNWYALLGRLLIELSPLSPVVY